MEDIDGGLHPAVDGQSLDEMGWEVRMFISPSTLLNPLHPPSPSYVMLQVGLISQRTPALEQEQPTLLVVVD